MSGSELTKLLDDRDADGEKGPQNAGVAFADPITAVTNTQQAGSVTSPQIFRTYWSDPVPPLALDNTRTKTEQARSVTGYMEILATTFYDGHEIYDTPLGSGLKTRIY
ncbi:hypothetical protein [Bosea sp. (in: a-proteobacteria)]|uniref:hypothetical protein n=1 Tax=Bosea sp. (in: a-proteobacteria) TaxID=1871050 RepID=UPI0027346C44|nr:hypothetical protein [Bosea sp. (in: a-proteobacteria)]MDP3408068.1 hypothetical protein [Bosea sp. (in: a-proteobacteria)]